MNRLGPSPAEMIILEFWSRKFFGWKIEFFLSEDDPINKLKLRIFSTKIKFFARLFDRGPRFAVPTLILRLGISFFYSTTTEFAVF